MVGKARHGVWKYFGAMMMERKSGVQAVSWTRFLGLITFGVWIVLEVLASFGVGGVEVPPELTAGMLGFAGIKGAKDVAKSLKGS